MILDKNGKLFGKISIIDLAVILICLAAAVGIGARFVTNAAKNVTDRESFAYTVEIEDVRIYTVNALMKKGTVTDKSGNILGEITDVKYEEMTTQKVDAQGKAKWATVPGKYKVQVTVEASGKESDKGYFVGENTELAVGVTLTMGTKYVNSSGKIINIEKNE